MEIKCSYSSRYNTLKECCSQPDFCLEKSDSGLKLKKSHMYWIQVQGQLLVTGTNFCIFILFTQTEIHKEKIVPDIDMMNDLLQKLYDFYCNHARKFIEGLSSNAAVMSVVED